MVGLRKDVWKEGKGSEMPIAGEKDHNQGIKTSMNDEVMMLVADHQQEH